MKESERWFSSVALIAAVLPLILIAIMLRLFPEGFNLTLSAGEISVGSVDFDTLKLYYLGLFCIIPLLFIVFARLFASRRKMIINFNGIILGALLLSVAYLYVILHILLVTLSRAGMSQSAIPFNSFIYAGAMLALSLLSNLLFRFKSAPIPYYKRASGSAAGRIWTRIVKTAAPVMMYWFLVSGIIIAFGHDMFALYLSLIAAVLYYVFLIIYSHVYTHIRIRRASTAIRI